MPAYFDEGFMVRIPAWHGLGVVLDDYPGREEGMELAGHNFDIEERQVYVGVPLETTDGEFDVFPHKAEAWKALVKSKPGDPSDGTVMHIAKTSYGVIPNYVGWDLVDALVGEGAKYETAGTLEEGRSCWVLAYLDEPVQIKGDNSPILPFLNVAWRHDGLGALTGRSTSVRVVCANTQSAAEAEARRLGTDYTFRHTKNVMDRIEDAKMALQGLRAQHQEFIDMANDLAKLKITKDQRTFFLSQFVPMPPEALVSDRVMNNIEEARAAVVAILNSTTVPDAHRNTGYGLWCAGVEYLDHVRRSNNLETKFKRSIMRAEPAKAKLHRVIKETVTL
jgi:phage/plasmid-like protein (TIGR03299 family)